MYKFPFLDQLNHTKKIFKTFNALNDLKLKLSGPAMNTLNILNDSKKRLQLFQEQARYVKQVYESLKNENINTDFLENLFFFQIIELDILSKKSNLTFIDLVEDILKLFDEFEYEKAYVYLSLIEKRKEQAVKPSLDLTEKNNEFTEYLQFFDEHIRNSIQKAVNDYKQGIISLNENEIMILKFLKKDDSNALIAKNIGFSVRRVEDICKKLRELFNIDFVSNKNEKRLILKKLAKELF